MRAALDGIGDGLAINPLAGDSALDQAREQIGTQVEGVQSAIDDLRTQIRSAPDDPVSQEAQAALDGAMTEVDDNQQAAVEQAQAVADAGSLPEAVAAAAGALGAVEDAMGAVGELVGTATGAGSGASAEIRAAFAEAPVCQALNG